MAFRSEDDWEAKLRAAFKAYASEVLSEPKAARLALVEALGAGPAALAERDRGRQVFEHMLTISFRDGFGTEIPPAIAKAVVAGVERITRMRLLHGGIETLPALADELMAWVSSYSSPRVVELQAIAAVRYRAPVRSRRPRSASQSEHDRILTAAAKISASGGYAHLTRELILLESKATAETFDSLYESSEACFLDALSRLGLDALVYAAKRSQSTDDRLAGVRCGIAALMEYLARDPVLVQIGFVEVFRAGPAVIERREWLLRQFSDLLSRSLPESQRPSELALEATVGAIWGLVHHQVTRGSHRLLPALTNYATFLALAPSIGAEGALAVIWDGRGCA